MSGTGHSGGPPRYLTPIAPGQPIGRTADGQDVLPTMYFGQMLQRILAYLGQPSSSTSSGSFNKTVSESLSSSTSTLDALVGMAGTDGYARAMLDDLAVPPFGFPPNGSGTTDWPFLPAELRNIPYAFIIPKRPPASQVYNVVAAMPWVLPANFAGAQFFATIPYAADGVWTVKKIVPGVSSTTIGTITCPAGSYSVPTLTTQAYVEFAITDVLQLVSPATQDATASDLSFTILGMRV